MQLFPSVGNLRSFGMCISGKAILMASPVVVNVGWANKSLLTGESILNSKPLSLSNTAFEKSNVCDSRIKAEFSIRAFSPVNREMAILSCSPIVCERSTLMSDARLLALPKIPAAFLVATVYLIFFLDLP